MLADHSQKVKQKCNISKKKKLEIYISECTEQGLFLHDRDYSAYKDLPRTTASDKFANEFYRPITRKFKKCQTYSSY